MKRAIIILGSIVAVLALLAGAVLVYANVPNEHAQMQAPADVAAIERNTELATALTVGGLDDAFVDVTDERALVAYDLPEGSDGEFLQDFALGAAAQAAPESARAVIVQNANGTTLTWDVPMTAVVAYLSGEIDDATLRAAIVETREPDA